MRGRTDRYRWVCPRRHARGDLCQGRAWVYIVGAVASRMERGSGPCIAPLFQAFGQAAYDYAKARTA